MRNTLIIALFLTTFCFLTGQAQQTIWLLNGQKISTKKYSIDKDLNLFFYQNDKDKTKDIELDFIFSVVDSLGKETVLYIPDTINEEGSFLYNETEMRQYMAGAIEARENYKGRIAFCTGLVAGFTSVFIPSPFPKIPSIYVAPAFPTTNTLVVGALNPSEKRFVKKYPNQKDNVPFKEGYLDVARDKRTRKAIYGGAAGFIVGVGSAIIYYSSGN